ncbi:MAG TPA: helix-turn-helix transcriptional regulator [Polyangiaceae bacterium]|jgi:predicted transcriptional regulator|nr:helix-turn-helix transcriptional regulator [Polyangiaceae bacterium]
MASLPEQLRAARRERKLSQKDLGARLGLPQSHVSAIEGGKVDPRLSSVLELARQLDLEPMLIPRARVPAVRALLTGTPDEPLWQAGEDEEGDPDDGDGA